MGIYFDAFAEALAPELDLTVSDWADKYRILDKGSSAEPGKWRTSRVPYMKEIMDKLSVCDEAQTVVFMKGAQVGATEAGNCWLGYIIHHAPGPTLYVMPTVEMAKRASKQRIAPMIDAMAPLRELVKSPRSRDSGNTLFIKDFRGGTLILTGSNSAVGLRSMPARYLFLDEVDAYASDVGEEGDPLLLAVRRTATYRRNRKIFMCSTPTIKGASHIEKSFLKTDQRLFHVPCPHCGHYQPILWRNLLFDSATGQNVRLECEHCRQGISDTHKTDLLTRGEWRATEPGDPETAGYHLSSLYSPSGWYSWSDAVNDFLHAKAGGPAMLKTWTNTVLGETWEEQGEQVETLNLIARQEAYEAEVPSGAYCLTAGVDVQDDRLEVYVAGWGHSDELWWIDAGQLWGDPSHPGVWDELSAFLGKTYRHESGTLLSISATCIDSGGHYTQMVYDYCKLKSAQRVYATKGVPGAGRPLVSAPSLKQSGRDKRKVPLFTIGVDDAKGLLFSRLQITVAGPGFVHIPSGNGLFSEEFVAQLTAEKRVTRYKRGYPVKEWTKTRPRNEALDCAILNMAALRILNPNMKALAAGLQGIPEGRPQKQNVDANRRQATSNFIRRQTGQPWLR